MIRWEPGDKWEPVQRWMIWQMRPKALIRPDILKELEGPDPRSEGHYCDYGYCLCRHKKKAWKGGAARLIDRQQWLLYRETGCLGSRWWTVQGDQGGHRHRLDQIESKVSVLNGGLKDTPSPGDLPYADFDNRVLYKVAQLDKVRVWKHMIDFCDRNHDEMDAEELEAKKEVQGLLWKWLETQSVKALDNITRTEWNDLRDAAPRVLGQRDDTNYEASEEAFINQPNF